MLGWFYDHLGGFGETWSLPQQMARADSPLDDIPFMRAMSFLVGFDLLRSIRGSHSGDVWLTAAGANAVRQHRAQAAGSPMVTVAIQV